ncbi:MAG TPA: DUF58 domain-containing protein, partial [Bryobacteraceae bacterium]|nr:DUF58 domain-containing protein [Bryobacteraceae bacterium]
MQRFLDTAVLASISGLDLVAKTIVQGFIAGLHRSPEHGFSQEFAEYRAYTPGDDLRYVDWNAFARTERCYLKRYRGETNTQLTVLLDASASMGFGSHRVNKIDYARYLAASLLYLANRQRDAAGLIVFDDEVRNCIAPSSRHGQLSRLLHGIEGAEPRARTDYAKPFVHLQNLLHRRGLVAVISDFYAPPDDVIRTMEPLALRGNELMLFHVLDPEEIQPTLREPGLLVDMETDDSMEVSPEYARTEYRHKI